MKKRTIAALLAALLLLTLCGCDLVNGIIDGLASDSGGSGSTESRNESTIGSTTQSSDSSSSDMEDTATQFIAETQFTNSFLGVSFAVPSGWWEYRRNTENFNQNPETTVDTSTLDIYMDSGYRYISLGKFASLQDSTRSNHLGVDFYAERIDGLDTLESYTQDYEDYMLTPDEDYGTYTLTDSSSFALLGREWTLREYDIPQDGGSFRVLCLVCQLETGYYLVVEADYWPENDSAQQTIIELLEKSLTLTDDV